MSHVLVWDLESIPDLAAVARVNGLEQGDETGARAALGEKFPKLLFHKIACIGVVIAERGHAGWEVRSIAAPHLGDRSEAELIQGFADRIAALLPRMVTFNGASFDLPVLRYRAMINSISAPGLDCRPYYRRYTDDCLDLCDALSCFDARGKVSLNDLCLALGLAGKPDGIDGSQVDRYVQDGRIQEVANYCETDVVSTYRVWLRYELFRGAIGLHEFAASEENLLGFIRDRIAAKPHLTYLLGREVIGVEPGPPVSPDMGAENALSEMVV